MILWRIIKGARSFRFVTIPVGACFFAVILMIAGVTYGEVHDHEDHTSEHGGECNVCIVTALGNTKAAPDVPTEISLIELWFNVPQPRSILITVIFGTTPNPARGPPLLVSF